MIDQHSITMIGQVERDVLVCLLAAGAAVLVPDIDRLTIFDEGCETFPKAIDNFTHTQR